MLKLNSSTDPEKPKQAATDTETSIDDEELGSLAVLPGVRKFPMRVQCASLAWHTRKSALAGSHETATTE